MRNRFLFYICKKREKNKNNNNNKLNFYLIICINGAGQGKT